jgi:tetratricopeptide (TPR) repeat protein
MFHQQAAFGRDAKQQQSAQSGAKATAYRFGAIDDLDYAANEHHAWSMTQLDDALKKNPNSPDLLADRARAYMLDGDYESATVDFNNILARDPHFGRAYLLRTQMNVADKNWSAVFSDLRKAQQYGTPNVSLAATERLALYLREQKRYEESLPEYDKLISSGRLGKKLLGRLVFQRGEIFLRTNRPEQGLAAAAEALKLDPDLFIAYMARARTYSMMNKLPEAISDYSSAIDKELNHSRHMVSPMLLEAFRERAQLYARTGHKDLARRDLVTAKQYERETLRDMPFRMP